jgi:hypothetical protein
MRRLPARPRCAQVSDAQLLGMLEKVNEQMPKTGITVRAPAPRAAERCPLLACALTGPLLVRATQINRRRPQLFEDD